MIEVDCTHRAPLLNKYTVAIIGCGSIGALKADEYDRPGGDAVLTHAHAFHAHPQTEIVAFIDNNVTRAIHACKKWGGYSFESTHYMLHDASEIKPDIVVVATPTVAHYDTLRQVLALKPKLVVAEKPFCQNLKEAQKIHDVYAAAGIPVVVNYIRRFDAVTDGYLRAIKTGEFGKIYAARCVYGRGLRRDGCHAVEIFNYVFGQPRGLLVDHSSRIDDGGDPGDASYNLHLEYEACRSVHMVAADSRAWGAFEIEFICEKGVVSFVDWGKTVVVRTADNEETFGQYKALRWPAKLVEKTGLKTAMLHMADNCVRHLRDGVPHLFCTSADAVAVHQILEQVKPI